MADFTGGPGLLAFIATFTMVLAAILLFRSLGKHLRKVRTHPPESGEGAATGASAAPQEPAAEAPIVTDDAAPADDDGKPERA